MKLRASSLGNKTCKGNILHEGDFNKRKVIAYAPKTN